MITHDTSNMAEQNENAHSFFDNCHLLNMTTFATSQQPTRRLSVTPRPQERFSLLTLYNWWISVVTLWLGYHALSPFLVVVAHEGRQPNGYLLIKSCKPLWNFCSKTQAGMEPPGAGYQLLQLLKSAKGSSFAKNNPATKTCLHMQFGFYNLGRLL